MSLKQITPDKEQPSELFEGLVTPEQFCKLVAKPGKPPPTVRTAYRWMNLGIVVWTDMGDQRFIDVPSTRELLMARARRPNPDRQRRGRKRDIKTSR